MRKNEGLRIFKKNLLRKQEKVPRAYETLNPALTQEIRTNFDGKKIGRLNSSHLNGNFESTQTYNNSVIIFNPFLNRSFGFIPFLKGHFPINISARLFGDPTFDQTCYKCFIQTFEERNSGPTDSINYQRWQVESEALKKRGLNYHFS